jgi:hypothetical protein
MKKLTTFFALLLIIGSTRVLAWTGSGTIGAPYQITTPAELATLATNVNAGTAYGGIYFKLMNDLSLSGYPDWNPIGNGLSQFFKGVFDGNYKKITSLSINNVTRTYYGLFGNIGAGCEIKDLTIESCSIAGLDGVGALVGRVYLDESNKAIKISNCKSSGTVSATYLVGGLIGYVQRTNGDGSDIYTVLITNCSSTVTVSASGESTHAGGLIGYIEGGDINSTPIVSNSYATGNVTVNSSFVNSGGLIGYIIGSKIVNCYARGSVTSSAVGSFAGGFAGYVTGSTITKCYSTGAVVGTDVNKLGFIGYSDVDVEEVTGMIGLITSCYWDKGTSGKTTSAGTAVGKTTAEMKTQSTYTGWDFTTPVWKIAVANNNGYPELFNPDAAPGTSDNPYQITTAAELATLATNVNGGNTFSGSYFKLMNDLSLSGYPNWDPIGNGWEISFKGVFDGNNKKITGLTITGSSDCRGLFGSIAGGCEIKDLTIEDCNVTGNYPVGALAGYVALSATGKSVKITNCKSSGSVAGNSIVGGLIGYINFSGGSNNSDIFTVLVTYCSSSTTVSGNGSYSVAGGLIGDCQGLLDTQLGFNMKPIISRCFATGNVTTNNTFCRTGGFAGQLGASKIDNCYAFGSVSALGVNVRAGGFAGVAQMSSLINCYSAGPVSGTVAEVLGFIGYNDYVGTISSCYWDKETSGKTTSGGPEVGKTTLEMKTQGTFTGWDFATPVWKISAGNNNGYPALLNPSDVPATTPTTQANTIVFSNVAANTTTIGWSNGDGAKRVVFVKQDNTGTASPVDNATYTANTAFGNSGSQIASSGWYCVYNGSSNSVDVTGLAPSTNYIAQVFEYNGSSGSEKYLTTTATDNPKVQQTIALIAPVTQATTLVFSAVTLSSMTASWTIGNGTKRAVFVKQDNTGTASPVDNATYTANTSFGNSGSQIASSGWYCVYNGTSNTVDITGLATGTNYIAQVFEYNGGAGSEKYLTTTATNNPKVQQTIALIAPVNQATTLVFSAIESSRVTASWTIGNGTSRAVFVKQANTGTALPVNNTTYTANVAFGSGNEITGTGWYCVYNGTGTSVTITGLTLSTDYIVHVCEYNGSAGTEKYLTSSASNNPKSQATSASVNYAIQFDGADDYVSIPDNNSLDVTTNYTIEAWIRPSSFASLSGIVSKYQNSGSYGYFLRLTNNGSSSTGITFDEMNTANGLLTANTWYHIAAVNNNGTRIVYINGVSVGLTGTAASISANSDPVRIGSDYSSRYFSGNIDEVRIWNVARTAAQITDNKNVELTGNEPGIVAYYKMSNGSDITLSDNKVSGTAYAGTLNNGPVWVTSDAPISSAIAAPTSQASPIVFSNVATTTMTIGWSNGNGAKRAIFVKQANTGTASPVDYVTYTANAAFGNPGSQIASSGWYCVYNGTSTSVDVTGLAAATDYITQVFEYNGGVGSEKYLTTTATDNPKVQQTAAPIAPVTQANSLLFSAVTSGSVTASWTIGNGTSRAVFVKQANTGTALPVNNTTYTANTAFGNSGSQIASSGWYCVYNGTGTSVTISGLSISTEYIVHVCEYNGAVGTEKYLTSTASNNPNLQATSASVNYAIQFDGADDYVSIPDNNTLDMTTNYTIEAWIRPSSFASLSGIVSKYQNSGSSGYYVRLTNNGSSSTGITFDEMNTANGLLTANTWYHIAAVNSGGTRIVYINGVSVGLTGTALNTSANSDPIRIGSDYSSRYFSGNIDEVRIWNVARTEAQIVDNKNIELTGNEPGIVAYYKMSNGSDITLSDNKVSGTAYSGTLANGPLWVTSDAPISSAIAAPTSQASTIAFSNVATSTMTIGWSNGNGAKRAIFLKQANTGTASPIDYASYTANAAFGNPGSQIASSGWYCVYNGTSTSVDVTGLTAATDYIAQVFEYNGGVGSEKYLTTTATDNPKVQQTAAPIAPLTQANSLLFSAVTSGSVTASWTIGNGSSRAVFVKQANTGTALPVNNNTYSANTAFISGTQIGSTGWYCVYNGTGTSVTISGLSESTDYIVHVCEYNGSAGTEKYLTSSASNNPKSQSTSASVNYSIQFDGADDYVSIPDNNTLDMTTNYTIEAWIRPSSFASLSGIVSKYHNAGSSGYYVRLTNNGSSSTGITFDEMNTANGLLTANTWYHIAAVNSGGTRIVYINGVSVGLTGTALNTSANSDPIRIGSDYSSRYFSGNIDEVRIWNVVRTEAQIAAYKDIQLKGNEPGLVAYYKMSNGTGTTLSDNKTTGTAYNGTLTYGPVWVSPGANVSSYYNIWNNTSGTNWGTAANWLSGTLPDLTDNVTIKNASAKPIVNEIPDSPALCKNLTIESGGILTIAAGKALTVYGNLTNSSDTTGLVIKSDIIGSGSLKVLGSVSAPASVQRFASLNRWYLVSSPIGTQTIKDFIAKNTDIPILSNDANTYGMRGYSTGDLSEWSNNFTNGYLNANTTQPMGVGTGYLVRTYSDGLPKTLNFQGNLNSQSNLDVTLTKSGTNGWNLIGNPYTSAIKIHDGSSEIEATPDNFINANDAKFDDVAYGVYFWNDASIPKKFDVINNINKPITFAQVGQGFFVRAQAAGSSTVSFTTDMQYHKGDEALKSSVAPNPKIVLVASMGGQSASTDILFIEGATKGLDRGYDAGILKADPSFSLFTKLVEPYDAEFQLQCLPPNQYNNLVIPIGIDSKSAGEIVFSVETVQLDPTCKVILEDKLTNTFTDLSKGSYKAVVVANTSTSDRFFLHTSDIVSGLEDQVLPGKLTAYAKGNKEIRIIGEVAEGAVATLVNGLGQVVITKKLGAGNLNIIGIPNLTSGLYLLNINDKGTPQTIKIMIRK